MAATRTVFLAPKSLTPEGTEKVLHTGVLNREVPRERRKRVKKMSDTQVVPETTEVTEPAGELVSRTVFDLDTFDKVELAKYVELPAKPASIQEALQMLDNDSNRLLEMVYLGISEEIKDKARADISGFYLKDETSEKPDLQKPYAGNYADEGKMTLINNAVLSFAKLNGWDKDSSIEEKRRLKQEAQDFIRKSPGMLKSLKG